LNMEARAPMTANRRCLADRRSKSKSINFNNCRPIRVFCRHRRVILGWASALGVGPPYAVTEE
jgi:hypothetical protein